MSNWSSAWSSSDSSSASSAATPTALSPLSESGQSGLPGGPACYFSLGGTDESHSPVGGIRADLIDIDRGQLEARMRRVHTDPLELPLVIGHRYPTLR
jgi:hypothetical protein